MRKLMLVTGILLMLVAAAGAYWFEPWKLFTSTTVNDSPPVIFASGAAPTAPPDGTAPSAILVAQGEMISHEHTTTGTVQLVKLEDGSHQIIIRSLSTSDGPDLRVWLTDQSVLEGAQGWRVFDDGAYVELGPLKGNKGTLVYDVPAETDVTQFRSVAIWCKRFSVSFGAAEFYIQPID
jgi:hypothetical protein